MSVLKLHIMTAKLVIPIEAGPRLSQSELDAFIDRHTAAGRNPDEVLTALIVEAIRAAGKVEAQAVTPEMAA